MTNKKKEISHIKTDGMPEYISNDKPKATEFELSNGIKVQMTEPNTEQVLIARELAKTPARTYLYLIAECSKFNGSKLTASDICKFRAQDYLMLEANISQLAGEKNL